MFDEQPDGDPHGECAATIRELTELLGWAYGKLARFSYADMDDCLKLDAIKLHLMTTEVLTDE